VTKALPLAQLSKGELDNLRRVIARRQLPTPLSQAGLDSIGKGGLFARLGPLAAADEEIALALIDLALAAGERWAHHPPKSPALLTWTEPTVALGNIRATTPVLLELLGSAQKRVVLAGYEFDHGAVLFKPLHKAMVERGVQVSIYLDVRPAPSPKSNMSAYLALQAHRFLKRNWTFGVPVPEVYYFPAGCEFGSHRSLHATCVVVDETHVMVGSANFTQRGHSRNLEVGVRLEDPALAAALTQQLERLVHNKDFLPLPLAWPDAPPKAAEDDGEVPPSAQAIAPSSLADELLVSDAARPLFARLIAASVPVPQVGEDVEGPAGQVIGSPELSWCRPPQSSRRSATACAGEVERWCSHHRSRCPSRS